MLALDQVDIQNFIDRFSKDAKKEKASARSADTVEPELQEDSEVLTHPLVIEMRNDYESRLMQKDMELRWIQNTLEQIRRLVGAGVSPEGAQPAHASGGGGNVTMWIEKLGSNRSPAKILRFLADKSGLKFTRTQVALGAGLSSTSGGYAEALALLRRNRFIVQQDGFISINPDL